MHRDRIRDAIFAAGFGPLCEQNPPAPGTPPTGDPAPGAPAPNPNPGGGGGEDRSTWIPRNRFDEVNGELQKLRKAEEERQAADLAAKGEHEKLAESEKAKRVEAEARAVRIARRAAFVAGASGKVADVEAAYALASAAGMLDKLDVDDEGNAKDAKAIEALLKDLIEKHPILKTNEKSRSFGDDRSGAGNGGTPADVSKMSGRDMLRAGYEAIGTGSRRP